MKNIDITLFEISIYDEVFALWQQCEGVGLSDADSRDSIIRYLERNPGMSLVALSSGKLVGAILAGHDGRRGYIHHLAVHPDYRRQGLGRRLVDCGIKALQESGIQKCHIFIFNDNHSGLAFWEHIGWNRRLDLCGVSKKIEEDI